MYSIILLALDTSASDRPIIDHVKALAMAMRSRVVLLHVATGASAQWRGADAGGEEVTQAKGYLSAVAEEMLQAGVEAEPVLCYGQPAQEIIQWVENNDCDLIAMGTHGHRLIGDLLHGFTASKVQHRVSVPVLLLRAK